LRIVGRGCFNGAARLCARRAPPRSGLRIRQRVIDSVDPAMDVLAFDRELVVTFSFLPPRAHLPSDVSVPGRPAEARLGAISQSADHCRPNPGAGGSGGSYSGIDSSS
jgi:hypothetical protein